MDPNPAVAARKNSRLHMYILFKKRPLQKVLTAYMGPTYQIKVCEVLFKKQKNFCLLLNCIFLDKTLRLDTCSKVWGNLGKFGEILGKYHNNMWYLPRISPILLSENPLGLKVNIGACYL